MLQHDFESKDKFGKMAFILSIIEMDMIYYKANSYGLDQNQFLDGVMDEPRKR